MEAAGIGMFVLVFFGIWVVSIVVWIVSIVEIVKLPDYQFKAAGTEKTTWVLIVVLVGIIGALIWRFGKRREVLGAMGRVPGPPPGWYADSQTGGLRWWDGRQWTEDRHAPPPPQ